MHTLVDSRMRHVAVRFLCLLVSASLLGACVSHEIDDLAFQSVELVDYRAQEELRPPASGIKPPWPLLKIEFSSRWDLAIYTREGSFISRNRSFFCERPDDHVMLSWSGVFWQGIDVDDWSHIRAIPRENTDALITYYIFASISRTAPTQSHPPEKGFDIQRNPEDICFYVVGGNGLRGGFRSNTVAVPREAIVGALRDLPPNDVD